MVKDALASLVRRRPEEARALCPVDAPLALRILVDGHDRLLGALRDAGGPLAIRTLLLATAAGLVEQLADGDGWPLFRSRRHAAPPRCAATRRCDWRRRKTMS